MNVKQLLNTSFAKNTFWILIGRIYQIFLNLVVSVVSVRYLGPSNYGLINYAASFSALLTAFCTLGIDNVMVNELIEQPQNQGKLLGTGIVLRTVSSILSVITICLMVFALNPGEPMTFWVTLLYSSGLILQSLETVKYFYQQRLMSKITSLLTVVVRTAVAVYKIMLLVWEKNVLWFAASNMVDHGIFGLLLLLAYRKHKDPGQGMCLDLSLGRNLLKKSHHFILSGLMVALYGQMDKIMIKHLLDETQVGYYSVAVNINNLWPFVIAAVIDSARPLILALFNKDRLLYKMRLTQLYSAVILISLTASAAISILAKPIVWVLYGEEYLSAVNALRIFTWSTAFSYLGVARSIWMIPNGAQRLEKYLAAIGAVSNTILNFLMIPAWGICGAALATLATQIITNFLSGVLFPPLRENTRMICRAMDLRRLVNFEK